MLLRSYTAPYQSGKGLGIATSRLIPQLKSLEELSEADMNSMFYRGIDNILNALDVIRKDNGDFRVIIFIDDLDRCSPGKTLEVLGSMKIFLSLDGVIYILGLSHEIVTKRARTETLQHLTRNLQVWGVLNLIGADLHRADLSGADLSGADLSGADLSGADLRVTYFKQL